MKLSILVINAGSSSLKFSFFRGEKIILQGNLEGLAARSLPQAFKTLVLRLQEKKLTPDIVAHRIVHGGDVFTAPSPLTPRVLAALETLAPLAPLHMPSNLWAARAAMRVWPEAVPWAVFDTAAFAHLDPKVRLYAIPSTVANRWHIHKYGFHGISHTWALQQAAKILRKPKSSLQAVTIHLGSGDSITRWRSGKPEDTSMGFTPLEGLTMSTRSGDLDATIPLFLQEHGYSLPAVKKMLQQQSGLFGLTKLRDMRDILGAAGHPVPGWPKRSWTARQRANARLAVSMFVYDVQRYLSSYLGLLPQPRAIIFTGSIGKNRWVQREVIKGVPAAQGIRVLTIPTNEERAIAEDVLRLYNKA